MTAAFRGHVEAFNAGDLQALVAGFTADARWTTGRHQVRGREDLLAFFAAALAGLRPTLEVRAVVADGDTVAAEMTERFTYDDQPRIAHLAAFFRFQDGLISRASIYREGSADPEDATQAG